MDDKSNEARYMTTPFEDSVMESLVEALTEASVDPTLIETLSDSFGAEKLPSADSLLQSIKQHSGDKAA